MPQLLGLLLLTVGMWILAIPRNGGPDEPSHSVASAALVRGEREGVVNEAEPRIRYFQVPAMVGEPNPACWAFQPAVPAGCAGPPADSTALAQRESTASDYPIWGHILPGLASFVPWPTGYAYLARLLNAALPLCLLAAAIARASRRGDLTAIGLLAGLTPIAWFSLGIVNPSGLTLAGAAAVWVAMTERGAPARWDPLLICGALAVLLPRRDGPLWFTVIVAITCLLHDDLPSTWWRRRARSEQVALAIGGAVAMVPLVLSSSDRRGMGLALAPVALVALDLAARAYRRLGLTRTRLAFPLLWAAGCIAAIGVTLLLRPGGIEIPTLQRIIGSTERHLGQLVGDLGWVDTPVPGSIRILWWALVGGLAALALVGGPRHVATAAYALLTTIVAAWVLELGFGDRSGTYWQGRYSLPVVLGIPLVLAGAVRLDPATLVRVRRTALAVLFVVWNVAFAAAQRRWGVGVDGAMMPWRWDTWGAPVRPEITLAVHAMATGLILRMAAGATPGSTDERAAT